MMNVNVSQAINKKVFLPIKTTNKTEPVKSYSPAVNYLIVKSNLLGTTLMNRRFTFDDNGGGYAGF